MKNRNITILFTTVILLLAYLVHPQRVQATDLDGVLPGGNNADGFGVLPGLTTGGYNTGTGWFSLKTVSSGSFNTAFGAATLFANTGDQNTATGAAALFNNTTGISNTANGAFALLSNTTASFNTANGAGALQSNTTGDHNAANGSYALANNTTGKYNTANGADALYSNTTGGGGTSGGNTAIGGAALYLNTTGSGNTALGDSAGFDVTTADNVIAIGTSGANVSNSCFIGHIYNTTTVSGTTLPVIVSDGGQLGTTPSSRRFKKEIKPMDSASESILALKPVTFHYKSDTKGMPQFGLIAEEVAEVNPDLVVRDKKGDIYTVRYDAVNAMLLNEFLKEHKRGDEQQASIARLQSTIAQQKKGMEVLAAQLKEQASKIQKVSAQLEVGKTRPQVVLNNP